MKYTKLSILILFAIMTLASCSSPAPSQTSENSASLNPVDWMAGHEEDAGIFADIYPVSENNPFLIASFEEVVRLFELGKGIVVFGFPDCPRCHNAFPVLEKAFYEMGMDKYEGFSGRILYYDIWEDREEDNDRYKTLVEYMKDHLQTDDSGKPRIYSPYVFFVNSGTIIGNHLDTVASVTYPRDPLSEEQEAELMSIYMDLIEQMENCLC
ncbi:MAG: hypothetical protein FWG88_02185 [Oscillospiraceae bacterium]|nr:hypothetical protein [Oscillospiraceae bacterium]